VIWTRSAYHQGSLPQVTYQTELGQMLDLITAPPEHVDFSKFTLEKYAVLSITILKTIIVVLYLYFLSKSHFS
jgi:farnesyl diphosphate synthase